MKKRLDLILLERDFFSTREKARREIMAGNVIVNEHAVTKAGTLFKDTESLSIRIKDRLKYVSRGGLKLEKAVKIWKLDLKGKTVLDIGASTGGFTDCMLQEGALKAFSVDVGKNQLDWKLKNDGRVVSLEETHIKDLKISDLHNEKVDFAAIDVSFISLEKVIPHLEKFLKKDGKAVMLIKPQFEVGKEKIGKNGIVSEEKYQKEAVSKITAYVKEKGYEIMGIEESPIKGAKGNKEFLALIRLT